MNHTKQREFQDTTFDNITSMAGDFRGREFDNCRFKNCNLGFAHIEDACFRGVHFSDCILVALKFDRLNNMIVEMGFERCDLSSASFYDMNLEGQRFVDCDLTSADFGNANLKGALFIRCNLDEAIFDNTKLQKADFTTSENVSINPERNQLRGARFNSVNALGLLRYLGVEVE